MLSATISVKERKVLLMAKQYLTKIEGFKESRYLICCVGYYHDTPDRNHRIYYMGEDIGRRFQHLGHASREMAKVADSWEKVSGYTVNRTYETKAEFNERYDV